MGKESGNKVISLQAFRERAAQKKAQTDTTTSPAAAKISPLYQDVSSALPARQDWSKDSFVAFSMKEQESIMALHATFSAISRDYSYQFGPYMAVIALLACAVSREELARFEKTLDEDNTPTYQFTLNGEVFSSGRELGPVVDAARPYLSDLHDAQIARNEATARKSQRAPRLKR